MLETIWQGKQECPLIHVSGAFRQVGDDLSGHGRDIELRRARALRVKDRVQVTGHNIRLLLGLVPAVAGAWALAEAHHASRLEAAEINAALAAVVRHHKPAVRRRAHVDEAEPRQDACRLRAARRHHALRAGGEVVRRYRAAACC